MGIEKKTGDIDNLYLRSYTNCISYEKTFKQTKFEEDRAFVEYYKQGLIIGNNVNLDYGYDDFDPDAKKDGKDEKFDGGLVADPSLFGQEGIPIFGVPSRHALRNVVDFDFSSMYPWMIITFNLCRSSMIGKLIIGTLDKGDMLAFAEDIEGIADKGKIFMEDYLTEHPLMLGTKWFGLPSTDQLASEISREFNIPMDRVVIKTMMTLPENSKGKVFKARKAV